MTFDLWKNYFKFIYCNGKKYSYEIFRWKNEMLTHNHIHCKFHCNECNNVNFHFFFHFA